MGTKTLETAVVIIVPRNLRIDTIRRRYERHAARSTPHISLLYPFRPREEFAEAAALMMQTCAAVSPFTLTLSEVRTFKAPDQSATLWLSPEPARPIGDLQACLQQAFPDCDDVARRPGGFIPHLCVGQAYGTKQLEERMAQIRAEWRPLSFQVSEVSLVARSGDSPFAVLRTVRLGMQQLGTADT